MAAAELLERNVTKSGLLSKQQMPETIPLVDVIRVLNQAKVSFVLMGAHGLANWQEKRKAPARVEVIVPSRQFERTAQVLVTAFEGFEVVGLPIWMCVRKRKTHEELVRVLKPRQQPYREILKHTRRVFVGNEPVRIPSLEMAVAMIFESMISIYRRDADKLLDADDFKCLVRQNPSLNKDKLAKLASLIYPKGDRGVLKYVRQSRAGETLIV